MTGTNRMTYGYVELYDMNGLFGVSSGANKQSLSMKVNEQEQEQEQRQLCFNEFKSKYQKFLKEIDDNLEKITVLVENYGGNHSQVSEKHQNLLINKREDLKICYDKLSYIYDKDIELISFKIAALSI